MHDLGQMTDSMGKVSEILPTVNKNLDCVNSLLTDANGNLCTINTKVPVIPQSLVENAFKHNSHSDEKPLKVSIELKDDLLTVSNNKMHKPISLVVERKGVGLKNLNKRYQLIVGKNIDIKDTQTEFTVTLKLILTTP